MNAFSRDAAVVAKYQRDNMDVVFSARLRDAAYEVAAQREGKLGRARSTNLSVAFKRAVEASR